MWGHRDFRFDLTRAEAHRVGRGRNDSRRLAVDDIQLAMGQQAPPFGITDRHGRAVMPEAFDGQAVILAFFDACGWERAPEGAISALRAELRGLGAVAMIVSREGIWCFRPDDDLELCVRAEDLDDARLDALRQRFRVKRDAQAFFIIDGDSKLRLARKWPASGRAPSIEMLASALSVAGQKLVSEPVKLARAVSRRELVLSSLLAAFALALLDACGGKEEARSPAAPGPAAAPVPEGAQEMDVTLNVNGEARRLRLEPRVSLLDALRERCGLTGTKKGCDHGQCGACTVLVDERRVNACLTLAVMVEGKKITTIEALAHGEELHPMQASFVAHDALQCGYCTPGQIMSAIGMLGEGHATTDDEVREEMSGNICRCGAHSNIIAAIQVARSSKSTMQRSTDSRKRGAS
jgi:xanthine dehydrogenase YagT iron-sulfur-binding subunit